MGATQGIEPILDYAALADDAARVEALLNLIPDPDTPTGSSGAVADPPTATRNTYLDEMGPACAAQLRVELQAILDS